ncbi:MAG: GNAT family N-acetyltransferase, partial [Pseudomonadota bacterium]
CEDAPATATLFFRAVHEGARTRYSEAECTAWCPEPPAGPSWVDRLAEAWTLVAETEGAEIAGFMSLTPEGVVDMAYVAPEWMGKGVALALYRALIARARGGGLPRLTTDASHLAWPFFEQRGWRLLTEQQVERHGVRLTNFKMALDLA